jgi:hypothetical protein
MIFLEVENRAISPILSIKACIKILTFVTIYLYISGPTHKLESEKSLITKQVNQIDNLNKQIMPWGPIK